MLGPGLDGKVNPCRNANVSDFTVFSSGSDLKKPRFGATDLVQHSNYVWFRSVRIHLCVCARMRVRARVCVYGCARLSRRTAEPNRNNTKHECIRRTPNHALIPPRVTYRMIADAPNMQHLNNNHPKLYFHHSDVTTTPRFCYPASSVVIADPC